MMITKVRGHFADFDCTVTIDGRTQKVTLTFVDNKGGFEVGPPH